MAKTKWTRKKKKTKPLKDITSSLKDVEIPKEKKKNDANLVEYKEKEANPVEDKESEMETNTNEENETEERVEDETNEANTVQIDAEEDRLEEERSEEEEEERSEEEEEQRSEEEKEEEANIDDVEVNEENSGEENEKERSEEEENEKERSEEEEANLDENNPPAANVQSNDGGREEGGRAEGVYNPDEVSISTQISNTMSHFDGEVKEGVIWPVPGFCIPMELLAFEAIEKLGLKFREEVPVEDVDPTCPRMCRSKFKRSEMKGFPLAKINKALGETTVSWRLTKIEEKVGEIDSRLAASEGFVQQLLDGRNVDADMEEEQGISKRSRNKTKDISSRAKKKSKKN
ncbi:hypothetical protein Bca52824_016081 [Brassica carinata]|uniref:Uncharacterized protein n=1 Tax=Brassica carinata TaxID=52824 RepID=A0A8X8B609_BRACI|nr:hypothetical protein Bca52824_016081 [Brassica carinata]